MLEFRQNGLEFPTSFSLKIIGRDEAGFIEHALAIVREYVPDLDEGRISTRMSAANTYISVTVPFTADSREQLDAIYRDLNNSQRVLYVI
jgi:putative lipoic acid-binding regulatory protein